jgi:hypothetical protein
MIKNTSHHHIAKVIKIAGRVMGSALVVKRAWLA